MMHLLLAVAAVACCTTTTTILTPAVVEARTALSSIMVYSRKGSNKSTSRTATYDCTIHNLWTKERHPRLFPSGAHWSPPVGVSHSSSYTMFQVNKFASDGVEEVAEVRLLYINRRQLIRFS